MLGKTKGKSEDQKFFQMDKRLHEEGRQVFVWSQLDERSLPHPTRLFRSIIKQASSSGMTC